MWKFHRKKNQQISKHRNVKGIANRISGEKVEKFEISVQITRNNSNGTTAESWKKNTNMPKDSSKKLPNQYKK